MKSRLLSGLAGIVVALSLTRSPNNLNAQENRRISTCLVNDVFHPADPRLINLYFRRLSQEYEEQAGVEFYEAERHNLENVTAYVVILQTDLSLQKIQKTCEKSEVSIFFTRSTGYSIKGEDAIILLGGKAAWDYGVIIIYEFGRLDSFSSMLHEVGHLFRIKFEDNESDTYHDSESSFMNQDGDGGWTQKVRDKIIQNKYVQWQRYQLPQ
ncbi:MAG: hypothetical protein AABW49_00190 [Nanoarchaeota archaeon]